MPIRIDAPQTSDGKIILLPCLFPPGVYMYFAGRSDSPTEGRGKGEHFRLAKDDAGDVQLDFQFNDWVLLAGGDGESVDAQWGDWITFEVFAPKTDVTPNVGGTGNCNLVEIPGTNGLCHVIVPAQSNGTHDVVLADAVPVPAGKPGEKTGYWAWDWPDEGKGTITPGDPGHAEFNLYDFEILLNRQLPYYQLIGNRKFELTVPAVNPGAVLPQWKNRCILHNENGHQGLKVVWTVVCARYKTV